MGCKYTLCNEDFIEGALINDDHCLSLILSFAIRRHRIVKIEVDNKEIPACAESEKNVINENVESEKKEDAQKDVKINEESLIEK